MEDAEKNKLIWIVAIVACIFFLISVESCNYSYKQRLSKEKEIAARMDSEEKASKFSQEKNILEQKLKTAVHALEEEKENSLVTKKALEQEQLLTQTLKEDLQKLTKLKEALEEDLKEALVTIKSKTQK